MEIKLKTHFFCGIILPRAGIGAADSGCAPKPTLRVNMKIHFLSSRRWRRRGSGVCIGYTADECLSLSYGHWSLFFICCGWLYDPLYLLPSIATKELAERMRTKTTAKTAAVQVFLNHDDERHEAFEPQSSTSPCADLSFIHAIDLQQKLLFKLQ